MIPYTRHKSLKREYWGLRINEQDLTRLGRIIARLAEKYNQQIDIKISTPDEEIRTTEFGFFLSPDMPSLIEKVHISHSHYSTPVSCQLSLTPSRAELSVDGTDNDVVQGVFHDIEGELKRKYHSLWWFTRAIHGHGNFGLFLMSATIDIITTLLPTWAVYSVFDLIVNRVAAGEPIVEGSTASSVAQVGWLCVVITFIIVLTSVSNFLRSCYPAVEFTGHLRDSYSNFRSIIAGILLIIVIPIIVNLITA